MGPHPVRILSTHIYVSYADTRELNWAHPHVRWRSRQFGRCWMSPGLNTGRIRYTIDSGPFQTIKERIGWGMIALTPANLTIFLISYLLLHESSGQMLLFFSYVLGITLSITIAGLYIVIVEKSTRQGDMVKVNDLRRHGAICSVCGAIVPAGAATCTICGSKLLRTCGFCGLLIGDRTRVCPRCKNPL